MHFTAAKTYMKIFRNVRFLRFAEMICHNFDVTQDTYGSYGCSITNGTQFYFSRISVSSDQSHISYRTNDKFHVFSKFSDVVFYVTLCMLRHVTLQNNTYGFYGTLW